MFWTTIEHEDLFGGESTFVDNLENVLLSWLLIICLMIVWIKILLLGAVVAAVMADEAPSYEKKYDGYFQYANVPGEKEYEFGYNRGNPSHYTSRYEQSKDHRFRTKV